MPRQPLESEASLDWDVAELRSTGGEAARRALMSETWGPTIANACARNEKEKPT